MTEILTLQPLAELGIAGVALASALWFAFVRVPRLFRQFTDDLRADRQLFQALMLAHDGKGDQHHRETLAAIRDRFHPTPEAGHFAR